MLRRHGAYIGPDAALIDVGAQCARWTAVRLDRAGLRTGGLEAGRRRFFVSDSTEDFAPLACVFLREDVGDGVERIDITRY